MECRPEGVSYDFLNLGENISQEIKVEVGLLSADDFVEVLEAQFVCIFKFTVVFRFVLDGVVGQVDEGVTDVVEVVLTRTRPNVAILVAVAFQ